MADIVKDVEEEKWREVKSVLKTRMTNEASPCSLSLGIGEVGQHRLHLMWRVEHRTERVLIAYRH